MCVRAQPRLTRQSQEPGELVTTTHRDYDLAEINKSIRGIFMGTLIVSVMHFYFGHTAPYVSERSWRATHRAGLWCRASSP